MDDWLYLLALTVGIEALALMAVMLPVLAFLLVKLFFELRSGD